MAQEVPDIELLRRYALTGSRDELAALVSRYVNLVYSAARRQLANPHWAQDVTQQVFVVLMHKARTLRPDTVLASWLLSVTTLECRTFQRGESRRAQRERKVANMVPEATSPTGSEATWDEVGPQVDAAMATLSAGDRDAVVLRYLQNRSYEEAASLLGTSEASVRQRVHRGLQKIRSVLTSRGVTVTEAALGTALLAHATEAAPASLTAATVGAMANASAKLTFMKTAAAMSAQGKATVVAIAVILATVGIATFLLLNGGRGDNTAKAASNNTTKPGAAPAAAQGPLFPNPQVAVPEPAAEPAKPEPQQRKLFDVITAKTCDERKGTKDGYDHIAFINRGDWVAYRDIDFGSTENTSQVTFCAVIACPPQFAGPEIEVRLGSPDGPVVSKLMVESSGGYGTFTPQLAPVEGAFRGVHDVYLVFTGGGFNLKSIKFTTDTRRADGKIWGTSYAQAKLVNEHNRVLVNVRDGAWARYDGLDFGSGQIDGLEMEYSVDDAHAGGRISVRLDRPSAASICDLAVVSTKGRFASHVVKMNTAVTGKHDVYLTFSGTNKGYQGLADVSWFRFGKAEDLAQAAATRPAAATRATATTRPASGPALR